MKTILEWIGAGSGLNSKLGNTSFTLTKNNKTLLVDCGFTVPQELMKIGKLQDIQDIIITHCHADHIGGLEGLGFMNYFAFKKRGKDKPNLYLATNEVVNNLWQHSLKGGMEHGADDNGNYFHADLKTYFNVHVGKNIKINGLPKITLFNTPHVPNLENYGVRIGEEIFYSGDTTDLPPSDPELIFQDCQFYSGKGDVHISYEKLNSALSFEVKAKTYLVHLGGGYEKINFLEDGFAGFVKPGDRFEF